MLPLWIVDLRKQSDRRKIFEDLLGQIDHVYMPPSLKIHSEESENKEKANHGDNVAPIRNISPASNVINDIGHEIIIEEDKEDEISVEERIDASERKKAKRESVIDGDWWRYTLMTEKDYGIDIHDEDAVRNNPESTAKKLYEFQTDLVIEGQKFIRGLRESNAHPDVKINIVVLGDIEEEFTRVVFPSVAGLLQKEKGRILPNHIHQGMEIIGMLYVPSNINSLKVDMRESMQRTLLEIDVQHRVPDMRGYDHMMLYQDVQNRTECVYPALNDRGLEEYLLQCIVNIYLASDETHPLLSGTAAADIFYFSMGATSICYDVENEDLKARHNFGINFMRSLKKEGDDEKPNLKLSLLNKDDFDPNKFFNYQEVIDNIDNKEIEVAKPKPHPIKDFTAKYLKRFYYNKYLRNFTKDLMTDIASSIEESTRGALEILASEAKRKFKDAKRHLYSGLKDLLIELSSNDGGFPTIIRLFRKLQDNISSQKQRVKQIIQNNFWDQLIEEKKVPRKMQDKFLEYHDAYEADIQSKSGGSQQLEMKKEVVDNLNDLLSKEATMLSRICRGFLLGVMLALGVVPFLALVSPNLLNFGNVRRYAEWWSVGLFLLPILIQFIVWWRYERKKRIAIINLKAIYLHDAFARVANRIESEINGFYDKIIALADRYVKRTEKIRDNIEKGYEKVQYVKQVVPETMFNQPLLGGKFGHEYLLPTPEGEDTQININYIPYKTSELLDRHYYLFMNEHYNMVMGLFKDVEICENLERRTNDETGKEELITMEQQEKEQEDKFKNHLKVFQTQLSQQIKNSIVPRINDSVGEKLVSSIDSKLVGVDVLEPCVKYASNNGEMTSTADLELLDIKINDPRVEQYIIPYSSHIFKNPQLDKYNYLYKKYIFITRWRCYEQLPLNRILPLEDFDEQAMNSCIYGYNDKNRDDGDEDNQYYPYPSTLLLWSLAPDDSSAEWFRLIDSEFFQDAYEDKEKYKEIINPKD